MPPAEQIALLGMGHFIVGLLVFRTMYVRPSSLMQEIPVVLKARKNRRLNPNSKLYLISTFLMGFGGTLFQWLGLLEGIRRIQSIP